MAQASHLCTYRAHGTSQLPTTGTWVFPGPAQARWAHPPGVGYPGLLGRSPPAPSPSVSASLRVPLSPGLWPGAGVGSGQGLGSIGAKSLPRAAPSLRVRRGGPRGLPFQGSPWLGPLLTMKGFSPGFMYTTLGVVKAPCGAMRWQHRRRSLRPSCIPPEVGGGRRGGRQSVVGGVAISTQAGVWATPAAGSRLLLI